MELTYANLSSTGPVRPKNEDILGFSQPRGPRGAAHPGRRGGRSPTAWAGTATATSPAAWRSKRPCKSFRDGQGGTPAQAGPVADLHRGQHGGLRPEHGPARPGTHGHHADGLVVPQQRSDHRPRRRLPRLSGPGGLAQQITTDHSYAAMQLRLGLISPQDAATSDMRCVLTRSLGKDPTIQVDYYTVHGQRRRLPRAVFRRDAQLRHRRKSSARSSATIRPRRPAGNWWHWRRGAAPTTICPCKSCAIDRVEDVMYYRGLADLSRARAAHEQ